MVTSPETEFVDCLTTEEIQMFWNPEDPVRNWSEVRAGFPDQRIEIFAPDPDSGTFDFFNETILDAEDVTIPDYNASADDNIIAQGVIGTPGSWGYFGFAYFVNNQERLNAIAYDAGEGCTEPSVETAQDDSYKLARPLFIYVKNASLERPELGDFVTFYLDNVNGLIEDVGYVPAPEEKIQEAKQKVEEQISAVG